jgi:hypothetical protein
VVLARLVTVSAELLALQARVHALVRQCPGCVAHMADGEWTPHVTLARRVPVHELSRAVELVATRRDETGHAVAARRWDGDEKRDWVISNDT